ncbi:MFS transporter [Pedobacter frigiditerrae]|uniref:MFS transporter n=1 Tax=Pedobacter frigiditerrae TaxID=2530452 RepID=A0A4V6N5N2_9SPHI|nr:MFS transporter [Pedobacter frigiditerrae]TCC87976.1 MFS transporter [Pedobacter frigiditerrae]
MSSTILQPKNYILPIIVIAQFFCTSLWFAGNAIISDLVNELHFPSSYLSHLTSAVQFGFIIGTLVFALLSISDRFSPSKIFFICAVIAALTNLCVNINNLNVVLLLLIRFTTGFFLAGIYPVGMKIAADHFQEGLGKSLGFLIGALVFGTAFPHFLKSINGIPWHYIVLCTSLLSLIGGLIVFIFVPDGPYRKIGQQLSLKAFIKGFSNKKFRGFAFGYFGHMWELYAFWSFVPIILLTYNNQHPNHIFNIPLFSFLIIAVGSIACVIGGIISKRFGVKKIATLSLGLSGACCLASPLFIFNSSATVFITFMFVWGMVVIADSPLFATLVAQNAVAEYKGSSLTIVNCIGFSITIISIQLIGALKTETNEQYIYMLLALGPILGLIALRKND